MCVRLKPRQRARQPANTWQWVLCLVQAAEDQQGLQASDLKAKVLKDVVIAKRRAQPDINTSIYRHNKAKGPNPMAFKKKKRKVQQPTAAQDAGSLEPKPKKARKRRKPSQPVDDESNP